MASAVALRVRGAHGRVLRCDPLAALVLCGAHRADRVMIGGKWVVEHGRIGGLDVEDLIRRHSAATAKVGGVTSTCSSVL